MKYTHIFRHVNEDPGFTQTVVTDSNSTPYIPASPETLSSGALAWDGRDVYLSDCAGCAASESEQPCAQRVMLRDLDEIIIHESDAMPLKVG